MSVLVEALTLIVRRLSLDVGYPGGTDTFLEATLRLEQPPRYVCNGDEHLVNLSFYDPDHLQPAVDLLVDAGLVAVDEESSQFFDFAFVDQAMGPTMPCPWLEWKRQPQGFTMAWEAGYPMGDMAAPDGWTPEQSRQLLRTDARDDADRMLRLAEEHGFETYLDFKTGLQVRSLRDSVPEAEERIRVDEEALRRARD